jgi:hypothetical protein
VYLVVIIKNNFKKNLKNVLSTAYHRNGYLETWSDFANTLSTSDGSKTHASTF